MALDIAKAFDDPGVLSVVQQRWDEIPPPVNKKKKEGKKVWFKRNIYAKKYTWIISDHSLDQFFASLIQLFFTMICVNFMYFGV